MAAQLQDLRLAIAAGTASGPDKPSDEVFDRLEEKYRALAVQAALSAGEASGEPRAFDAAAFKQRMLASHG